MKSENVELPVYPQLKCKIIKAKPDLLNNIQYTFS